MSAPADLAWPFFDDGHRERVPRFERWAAGGHPAPIAGERPLEAAAAEDRA